MSSRLASRLKRLSAAAAICAGLTAAAAPVASADYTSDYNTAYNLGSQAYVYGEPLMDMQHIFQTLTSVTVPDNQGDAPVNQWSHFTALATTKEGLVVAPNSDTLYSIAWLDLQREPIVLHVPDTGSRFNVVPLLTPYEENIANIGNGFSGGLAPGNYLIEGPGAQFDHLVPPGLTVIHAPYDRLWLIARTLVKNPADTANAIAIQAQEKLVPLFNWIFQGLNYTPPAPHTTITTPTVAPIPGTQPGENPLDYFAALGQQLREFPPPAADQPLLTQLASVGIGPGMDPSRNPHLSAGTIAGLDAAVAAGPATVHQDLLGLFQSGFAGHNGWLVMPAGNYGTNYALRAVVDQIGLGALPPNVSIYPIAQTDRTGTALNGATTRYVVHYPASDFPVPVQGFWSLTMYGTNGLFATNPLNRYVINDRSALNHNPDGSLDVYVQNAEPTSPAEQANWLPAPGGPFELAGRLYGVQSSDIPGILTGGLTSPWQQPTVLPCLPSGNTPAFPAAGISTGIACAS